MSPIPGERPRYASVDAITFERLYAPGHEPVFGAAVMASGFQVRAGTVLGRITSSGYLKPCIATANDGSQVPYAVASKFVDTTAAGPAGAAGAQPTSVILHGKLNSAMVSKTLDASWGATPDAAWIAVEPLLRAIGIFGAAPIFSA